MTDTIAAFARVVGLTLAALLPLINPLGGSPIFLSMTPGASDATRATLAARVARDSFVLLMCATLIGSYVLLFFGLSLAVVKIAGGLLVLSSGWQLIRTDSPEPKLPSTASAPVWGESQIESRGFYPLTFPLTIGPGSVSVAVTLGATTRGTDVSTLASVAGVLMGLAIVAIAIYVCYRFASRLMHALGETGTVVVLRLSAFILLSVGVQLLCDGIVDQFHIPMPR